MTRESARQDCIIKRGQSRRELRRFFYLAIIYVSIYIKYCEMITVRNTTDEWQGGSTS